ncbi:MAG: hypothetical protein NZM15_00395 [Flavobacteriales bacterium]|nr:hypothetical protein [Flavobacteriales bacterium]MDW8431144.1 hypothetical protein [Flavobacteriales bacterium]
MRDAEGGSKDAGTALSPRSGRRDCRSVSGARSSPTPGGPAAQAGGAKRRPAHRPPARRGHALKIDYRLFKNY